MFSAVCRCVYGFFPFFCCCCCCCFVLFFIFPEIDSRPISPLVHVVMQLAGGLFGIYGMHATKDTPTASIESHSALEK